MVPIVNTMRPPSIQAPQVSLPTLFFTASQRRDGCCGRASSGQAEAVRPLECDDRLSAPHGGLNIATGGLTLTLVLPLALLPVLTTFLRLEPNGRTGPQVTAMGPQNLIDFATL